MKRKISIMPDGTIKALDVETQSYVYLPNRLVDDNGELVLCVNGDHRKHYAIYDLTNDSIYDSAKKLRQRHGRTAITRMRENIHASKLEGIFGYIKRVVNKFHN